MYFFQCRFFKSSFRSLDRFSDVASAYITFWGADKNVGLNNSSSNNNIIIHNSSLYLVLSILLTILTLGDFMVLIARHNCIQIWTTFISILVISIFMWHFLSIFTCEVTNKNCYMIFLLSNLPPKLSRII